MHEAAPLGLRRAGVTGGEVFMLPEMPAVLAEMAAVVPTTALTNATLFTDRLLGRMAPLAGNEASRSRSRSTRPRRTKRPPARPAQLRPRVRGGPAPARARNPGADRDDGRGPDAADLARLCDLHRAWGIPDDDHVIRPVVRRGRAAVRGMGVVPAPGDILPELTITAEGAFLDPFAPTVRRGRTDVDRLVSRETAPMIAAVEAFLEAVAARPGADAERSIR